MDKQTIETMLSQEDYEYIKQYESTYEKAFKHNYARMLPRSVNEKLNEIIGGEKKNWGCSACCMSLYRRLYQVLNNEEAARQNEERKRQEELKARMAKAREAKKNKQINNEEENAKEKRPEQSDE